MSPKSREEILELLRTEILRVQPHLHPADITAASSLTEALLMDSLQLETLFTFVKSEIADVELTPWFVRTVNRGGDTLGELVDFLHASQAER